MSESTLVQQDNPQAGALAWLLEMEAVQNPYVLNSLVLNVFKNLTGLKDAQFVIDPKGRKLLVYLELTLLARWFRKEAIAAQTTEMLAQILPAFKTRVIFDKDILAKALRIAESAG